MDAISRNSRLKAAPDVLFSQVGDESVLLDLASGTYYSLDPVGTLVWAEIARGETAGGIHLCLIGQFSEDSDVIWADLVALITDLTAKGLVTIQRVEE
jgi:hypothetical protein